MFAKVTPKEEAGVERPIFFTCITLYALTSLAICGGVLYLILCVPEAKIMSITSKKVSLKPLELGSDSILASPQDLDTPVSSTIITTIVSDDAERNIRIFDDQDPSEESDSEGAGGLNKHRDRKPKPETLVLDLPEQLDQSETSEEELTKENFYQK